MRHQSIAIIHAAILALIFIPSLLEAQTTHTIMVLDNEFDPPMITIPAGDTVRWVNPQNLGAEHDVVSEDGLWTPPAVADAWTFSHTFNDEGTFGYFCTPHQALGMTGVIQVVASPGTGVDFNPGHNGNWWYGPGRSGEGAQVEVSSSGNALLNAIGKQSPIDGGQPQGDQYVFVATFYSYGPEGGQIFLIAVGTTVGDTVEVDIFITEGPVWGDDFDPADVVETQWGTGVFTSLGCDLIDMVLTPNTEYASLGYTVLAYQLVRLTTSAIGCPYVGTN
jgi:plastocyanin